MTEWVSKLLYYNVAMNNYCIVSFSAKREFSIALFHDATFHWSPLGGDIVGIKLY